MQVDEQQILSLSRELWSSHLGLNITPENAESTDSAEDRTLSSCIKVSGPWNGAIVLECSESVVRHAAAMLFASDGQSTSEEDIRDALNELAEMIGRRMRALLPESSKLSRPSLVADEQISGLRGLSDLKLSCEGRPVRIAVLDAEPETAAVQ